MSLTFDLIDRLYPILNVATVTDTIDGKVRRNKRLLNSDKRDVVIKTLGLRDGDGLDVQPGTVFVNCHARNLDGGIPDESNLNTTADAVMSVMGAFSQGSTYCHIEKINDVIFEDQDRKDESYLSIRFNVIIE